MPKRPFQEIAEHWDTFNRNQGTMVLFPIGYKRLKLGVWVAPVGSCWMLGSSKQPLIRCWSRLPSNTKDLCRPPASVLRLLQYHAFHRYFLSDLEGKNTLGYANMLLACLKDVSLNLGLLSSSLASIMCVLGWRIGTCTWYCI